MSEVLGRDWEPKMLSETFTGASSSRPLSSATGLWPLAARRGEGYLGPMRQSEVKIWPIFSLVVRILT